MRRSRYDVAAYLGKRFGERVVIGDAPQPRKGTGRYWRVRCDCGAVSEVPAASLIGRRADRCTACQRRKQSGPGHPMWRGHGGVTSTAYAHFRFGAKNRGIEWAVSIEHLAEVWERQGGCCPVSGRDLIMKRGNRHPSTASLDRIDSAVGYVPGNVRWVHKAVNFAKQDMSDAELIELCRDIVRTATP